MALQRATRRLGGSPPWSSSSGPQCNMPFAESESPVAFICSSSDIFPPTGSARWMTLCRTLGEGIALGEAWRDLIATGAAGGFGQGGLSVGISPFSALCSFTYLPAILSARKRTLCPHTFASFLRIILWKRPTWDGRPSYVSPVVPQPQRAHASGVICQIRHGVFQLLPEKRLDVPRVFHAHGLFGHLSALVDGHAATHQFDLGHGVENETEIA